MVWRISYSCDPPALCLATLIHQGPIPKKRLRQVHRTQPIMSTISSKDHRRRIHQGRCLHIWHLEAAHIVSRVHHGRWVVMRHVVMTMWKQVQVGRTSNRLIEGVSSLSQRAADLAMFHRFGAPTRVLSFVQRIRVRTFCRILYVQLLGVRTLAGCESSGVDVQG